MKSLLNLFFYILYGLNYKKKFLANSKIVYNSDKEILIYKIKKSLLEIKLENIDIKINLSINTFDIRNSFHQYIWSKFINTHFFNAQLIMCIAQGNYFLFPLPKAYMKEVSKFIKVKFFLSNLSWRIALITLIIKNIFSIFFSILQIFKFDKKNSYIYCKSLGNIKPNKSVHSKLDDFFLWAYKNLDIKGNTSFLHSNKKIQNKIYRNFSNKKLFYIKYKKNTDLIIFNYKDFISYIFAGIKFLRLFFNCILKNNFCIGVLYFEIFKFNIHKRSKKSFKYVLFNNSDMVFRPLWTYAQESKNKETVVLYFYSINNDPLQHLITNKNYIDYSVFSILTWDNYIVWGKDQMNWINKRNNNHKKIKIVKYIPFEGENLIIPKIGLKRLCIFDNLVRDDYNYNQLHSQYNIYTLTYVLNFLKDIIELTNSCSTIDIVLKTKRSIKTVHPQYLSFIDNLKQNNTKISIINDRVSAQSLILNSDLVISIPYSSTAVIAKSFNIKSIFYDPSGKLNEKSNNYRDIELINDKKKLEQCLKKFLK